MEVEKAVFGDSQNNSDSQQTQLPLSPFKIPVNREPPTVGDHATCSCALIHGVKANVHFLSARFKKCRKFSSRVSKIKARVRTR